MITSEQTHQLPMFILDVLRHDDVEQLPSILKMMNNAGCIGWRGCWPRDFTREEVIPALESLIRLGRVRAFTEGPGEELLPQKGGEPNLVRDEAALWCE